MKQLKIVLLSVIPLLFFSCLDVRTEIKMSKQGKVDTVLVYEMDRQAAGFGRGFGADEPWPFPLTERHFRTRAVQVPGTVVKSYRTKTGKDSKETVRVKLRSESLEDLGRYLGIDFQLSQEGRRGRFIMTLPLPAAYEGYEPGTETRETLEGLLGSSSLTFRFAPPFSPKQVNDGFIDRRFAEVSFPLKNFLDGGRSIEWIVDW